MDHESHPGNTNRPIPGSSTSAMLASPTTFKHVPHLLATGGKDRIPWSGDGRVKAGDRPSLTSRS